MLMSVARELTFVPRYILQRSQGASEEQESENRGFYRKIRNSETHLTFMKATEVFSTLKLFDVLELPLAAAHDAAGLLSTREGRLYYCTEWHRFREAVLHWFFRPLLSVL